MADIFNHLWQSTLFTAAVALLALAFRCNRARLRYGLWFAASVKFLVPFAALAAVGGDDPPAESSLRLNEESGHLRSCSANPSRSTTCQWPRILPSLTS